VLVLDEKLDRALAAFAKKDTILIALDFDGTLAPLGDDPELSRMIPEAREALEALTSVSSVTVALVTGRAIESIARVSEPLPQWYLVGSHGIEVVSPKERDSYHTPDAVPTELVEGFRSITETYPGTRIELKPFGVALHTRGVEESVARSAELAAHALCEAWGGDVVVRTGHGIVECAVKEATKGDGIVALRRLTGADGVLFAGDDLTDEDGFAVLGDSDVAIRVGGGDTIAPYRLSDAPAVAAMLWRIHELLADN
jgi:trehalose 6-phosphate phosphatase